MSNSMEVKMLLDPLTVAILGTIRWRLELVGLGWNLNVAGGVKICLISNNISESTTV